MPYRARFATGKCRFAARGAQCASSPGLCDVTQAVVGFCVAIDLVASMPGSKSRYSGVRRAKRARLMPAFDELLDMRRHEVQAAEITGQGLLQPASRHFVADAEAVEIEVEDALLLVVAWIAHPDMRIEASGALCQRFVDGFRVIRVAIVTMSA